MVAVYRNSPSAQWRRQLRFFASHTLGLLGQSLKVQQLLAGSREGNRLVLAGNWGRKEWQLFLGSLVAEQMM